jgi:V8-like Glu-specific endopeptidase
LKNFSGEKLGYLQSRLYFVVSLLLISVAFVAASLVTATKASPLTSAFDPSAPPLSDEVPLDELEADLMGRLGDRYTDVTVDEETKTLHIGVVSLTPEENDDLLAEFAGPANLVFYNATVSRAEVDALLQDVSGWAMESPGEYLTFGPDYSSGNVHVTVANPNSLSKSIDGLSKKLGEPLVQTSRSTGQVNIRFGSSPAGITTDIRNISDEETSTANPYRAGKHLALGGTTHNCSTAFLMNKAGLAYGMTAGHCGANGKSVRFAGTVRGSVQNNTLWASNPAKSDASLFRMSANGTAYLFQTTASNLAVKSTQSKANLKTGVRTCTRGAFTGAERCGALAAGYVNVSTWSDTARRYVQNSYCWKWEAAGGTKPGDSGAPVYQFTSGGVRAVGVHRAGGGGVSCFTDIATVAAGTGSTVWKVP